MLQHIYVINLFSKQFSVLGRKSLDLLFHVCNNNGNISLSGVPLGSFGNRNILRQYFGSQVKVHHF
jgi:hypothetical protein